MLTVEKLEEEIAALQKQATEVQATIFKIEGAIQFAYHALGILKGPVEQPAEQKSEDEAK